jgi:hypothetical protein
VCSKIPKCIHKMFSIEIQSTVSINTQLVEIEPKKEKKVIFTKSKLVWKSDVKLHKSKKFFSFVKYWNSTYHIKNWYSSRKRTDERRKKAEFVKRYYFFRFVPFRFMTLQNDFRSVSEFFSVYFVSFKKKLRSNFSFTTIFYNFSRIFWAVTLKFLVWVQYTYLIKWRFFLIFAPFSDQFRSAPKSKKLKVDPTQELNFSCLNISL